MANSDMNALGERIKSAKQEMHEVSAFLALPTLSGLATCQQRLVELVGVLKVVFQEIPHLPEGERAGIVSAITALKDETQIAQALTRQANGLFQGLAEYDDANPSLYAPGGWKAPHRT